MSSSGTPLSCFSFQPESAFQISAFQSSVHLGLIPTPRSAIPVQQTSNRPCVPQQSDTSCRSEDVDGGTNGTEGRHRGSEAEERFRAQLSASEVSANVVKNAFPHLRIGPNPRQQKKQPKNPNERHHQRDEPRLVAWWGDTSPQPTAASTGQNASLKTRKLTFHQQQHEDLCCELLHQGHNTHTLAEVCVGYMVMNICKYMIKIRHSLK